MTDQLEDHAATPVPRRRRRRTLILAAGGLLALGGVGGAVAVATNRPSATMAPATPIAIRSLGASGIVTIRGNVAEIYGNKLIVADSTGRALVDTGREGENGKLVTVGEPVTIQGRFKNGFVHAAFLVGPDGKVVALGPLAGPPHDHRGPPPPPPHGPDREGDSPPPPPASGTIAPAPAAAPANAT